MPTPLIKLSNVSKHYHRGDILIPVLEQIDLTVDQGAFLALMGPSGSGKTTLLNLLGGLDKASSGSIEIGGQCINGFSSRQLAKWRSQQLGIIFQFYNLLPVLSAIKNIELPLLLTSLSAKQRRFHADTALDLVGLQQRAGHYPHELSGGQQQRVAIARALVTDPSLLICDEPTGDLDRQTADDILSLLQTLNRQQQKTIVMVTHDPKAAEYAHYSQYMDKGKLLARSST